MQTSVEIYQMAPDCQVCGSEIGQGAEKKFFQMRVCDACKKELEEGRERGKLKQTRTTGSIRRR